METDDGEVEEMKSEAAQEEEEEGGGGQTGMSRDPYFNSLQGEAGRQKNLSACMWKSVHAHTQQQTVAR